MDNQLMTTNVNGDNSLAILTDEVTHTSGLTQVLLRRKRIIALTVVVGLAVGLLYAFKGTKVYRGESRVHVERRSPNIMQFKGITVEDNERTAYLNTQCQLIKSRRIVSAALEKLGLDTVPGVGGAKGSPLDATDLEIEVDVERNTNIINVACESPDSEKDAKVANALVEAYLDYHAEKKQSTAAEVLKVLGQQKERLNAQLRDKEATLLAFEKGHGTLSFGKGKESMVLERLSELNRAMTVAQIQRIDAEVGFVALKAFAGKSRRMLGRADLLQGGTRVVVSTSGRDDKLRGQLLEARSTLSTLTERGLGPAHPRVIAKKKEIQLITDELNLVEKDSAEIRLTVAEQNLAVARDKEKLLRQLLEAQKGFAQEQNSEAVEHNWVLMDVERVRNLYDIVVNRIKELNVTEDYGIMNISVIDAASVPTEPIRPMKARSMAAALVLSLMVGGALALVAERCDTTMKSAEEVEAVVGRPTLGMVPSMPGNGDRTIAERAMRTHLQPTSLEAEAFRTIRTAIYFSSVVEGTKTILVTSPAPGEGKTIVAANLAIAMAQAGQKTLLLDADFRRPSVHKAFELDKEEGVSTLVLDETSLESAVKRTEVHGLDILTCGERPPNPAEMLGSQKFAELLEHLTGMYDRVVVDSPPVLAVADSQILSRICGGVVAVVRARQSSRIDVARMRDSLAKVGGKLMGAVVNDIPRGRNGYYYGSKYYRYYDYYNKDDESGGNGEKLGRDVEVLVEDGVLSPHIRTRQWPWRGKPLES